MGLLSLAVLVAFQNPHERVFEIPVLPQYYQPPSKRPCLSTLTMKADVDSGQARSLQLMVPSDYSGQTVISLDVSAEPPTALKSWRLVKSKDGLNRLIEVYLADNVKGSSVMSRFRIMTPGEAVIRTQQKDFKLWKSSSKLVNSNDPAISALAQDLKSASGSLDQFVERTVKFVANNQKSKAELAKRQDSTIATEGGNGSLKSACFCAAIFRSQGVAARIVRYCPTWAPKGNTIWWLTEYESDNGNWEMVDPTVGIIRVNRNAVIVLQVPSVAQESSLSELAGQMIDVKRIQFFPGPAGAKVMSSAFRQSLKVIQSAEKGRNDWLDDLSFEEARTLGPTNFSLFLDGRPIMPRRSSGTP